MPFLQIKTFFILSVTGNKFFRSVDAVSNVLSNLEMFKETGKICSDVVLFLIIRSSSDSVKFGNISE